ncbi:hypothetical protein [Mycolicibacterium sp. HS_4_1]
MTYLPPGQPPHDDQPEGLPPGLETSVPPPGFPPPPGYALPQGYPPPPGFGYPMGYEPPFTAGQAWTWAWGQLRKRAGLLIGGPLAWLAIIAIVFVPFVVMTVTLGPKSAMNADGTMVQQEPTSPMFVVAMVLMYAVLFAAGMFMANCLMATQFDVADGKPLTLASFFKPRRLGPFVGVYLLVFLMTVLGMVACILPGIVLGFLGQYAAFFVVDRQMKPVSAIKASFRMVLDNLGTTILVYLILLAVGLVAEVAIFLTLGLGALAIAPALLSLNGLMHVVTYRRLSGGQAAPVA